MLLRVVLDTNIYYSAFAYPNSSINRIFVAAVKQKFMPLISASIVDELGGKLRDKAGFSNDRVTNHLKQIVGISELVLVHDYHLIDRVRDADDNHIVACAIAGKADLIVSGDKDLYTYKSFEGIGVSRPADFIRTLKL